jgi:transcriptional regulator with XRE-family HTH domain
MQALQAATERSCTMPRQRRWEPNRRLTYERERRGWSQDDAAREAERVAGGLGLPDLVFTGAQFGRWERGECRPRPPLRRVVCDLYDASAEALGLLDQGDGAANRRELLRNAVVLGAAAVVSPAWLHEESTGAPVERAEVASIRDALMDYDGIGAAEGATAVDLIAVRRQVQQAWRARQACAYRQPGVLLPRVLTTAQLAARQAGSDQRRAVNGLLAETYQCVTGAMANIGQDDLAWVAADRGILAAERSEDPLMVAASTRMLAHALLGMGRSEKAQQVALTALTTLEPGLGTAPPTQLSVYGALLQTSAVIAARRGDRVGANDFLTEAATTALRLGDDRNDFWTVFGPTNVGIHRASVAVELGDAGVAVEQARMVDPSHLPSLERRSRHLLDLAQGYGQCRKDHEAVDVLLQAERLAPQEVHYQPAVQRLVVELLQRERRTTKPKLRELATRVGVLAA